MATGMFTITEDDLTNAIFNNTALNATGTGTKEEARIQARTMLAAASGAHTLSADVQRTADRVRSHAITQQSIKLSPMDAAMLSGALTQLQGSLNVALAENAKLREALQQARNDMGAIIEAAADENLDATLGISAGATIRIDDALAPA